MLLAELVLSLCLSSSAEPAAGPSLGVLSVAAEQGGAQWADGQPARASAAASDDSDSELPPSPGEAAAPYEGFTKGFVTAFTAVEWVPNAVAAKVPVAGKPIGGILGLALLPVGLAAGLVGGLVALLIGLF
jgi:hypothetical protein